MKGEKSFRMADCASTPTKPPPVVVVVGTTGAGKSKLAIDVARHYGGEVISADSQQVYKGLAVGTNKVTEEEAGGIVHHLLSVADPVEPFTVVEFVERAIPIISRLQSEDKVPVVVGGTNYYIEALFWKSLIDDWTSVGDEEFERDRPETSTAEDDMYKDMDDEALFLELVRVDPNRASQLHQNDRKRVHRSLQVYTMSGRPHSELLKESREDASGCIDGMECRYPGSIFLWVDCADTNVLNTRLDGRVDTMLTNGILNEVRSLRESVKDTHKFDSGSGLLQAIGFKEFTEYFDLLDQGVPQESEQSTEVLHRCCVLLKKVTRRYARKQLTWIRNRFCSRPAVTIYRFDSSNVEQWNDNVCQPAVACVDFHLHGASHDDSTVSRYRVRMKDAENSVQHEGPFTCEACGGRKFLNNNDWEAHLGSRSHRNHLKKKKKQGQTSQVAEI